MFEKLRENSKIIIIIVAVAFAFSGAMMGFSTFFQQTPETDSAQQQELLEEQQERLEPIAVVNGSEIFRGEYENRISQVREQMGQLPSSQNLTFRFETLEELINRELLLQNAKEQGLDEEISEEEIDEYLQYILENMNLTEEELSMAAQMQGYELNEFLEEDLLLQEIVSQLQEGVEVSEEEVKEFFQTAYNEEPEGEQFEEIRGQLEQNLRQQKIQEEEENLIQELQAKAEVEIRDEQLSGMWHKKRGNYENAQQKLENAIENAVIPDSGIYIHLAEIYQDQEEFEKAHRVYEEAREEVSSDWDLEINHGNLYLASEQPEQAREHFDRAAELIDDDVSLSDQQLSSAHFQLYSAYNNVGAEEIAQEHLERAQELYQNVMAQQQMEQEQISEDVENDVSEEVIDVEMDEEDLDLDLEDEMNENEEMNEEIEVEMDEEDLDIELEDEM